MLTPHHMEPPAPWTASEYPKKEAILAALTLHFLNLHERETEKKELLVARMADGVYIYTES